MSTYSQYFGFEIPENLYHKSLKTIADIKVGTDAAVLNPRIAETLIDITEVGLEAYYHRPRDLVSISPMVKKAADAGISAIRKGVQFVIRKLFTNIPLDELKVLAEYMGQMLTHDDARHNRRFFITFALTDHLYKLSQELLSRVRRDPDLATYRTDIVDALADLIDAGVSAYYHEPVNMISLGKLTRRTADVGISASQKGANAVVHRIFKVLPHAELIPLSGYFDTLLHRDLKTDSP